jgi:hypothetical protein
MSWLGWRTWERFAAGQGVTYDGVGLRIGADGVLECTVQSTRAFENATLDAAHADLGRAEQVLSKLNAHPASSALTSGRGVRIALVCESGTGPVTLCTRTGNGLVWSPGLPRDA